MPSLDCLKLTIKIIDIWEIRNEKWNYVAYVLCEINNKLYLLEKEL
jgi:hypothetical protein